MHQQTHHHLLRMTLMQPTPGWMLVFSCFDQANVPFGRGVHVKHICSSGHNFSPSLTSKELIVNPVTDGHRGKARAWDPINHDPSAVPLISCLGACHTLPAASGNVNERHVGEGYTVTIHPRTSFTVLLSQVLSLRNLLWKKEED